MFLPLGVDRPLNRPTLVTYVLVGMNVGIFFLMMIADDVARNTTQSVYQLFWLRDTDWASWRLVTYAFLHGGFWHVAGNMLFLWIFGPSLEDRLGRVKFLLFYLGGAAVAGLAHVAVDSAPVVGASGAVAATTGAYLALFPRTRIRCLVMMFIIGVVTVPAWVFIGLSIGIDLFWLAAEARAHAVGLEFRDAVARTAHLGGYLYGFVICLGAVATGLLAREPYDLLTMGRQAYRRRQLREAVLKNQSQTARVRQTPRAARKIEAEEDPEEEARLALRGSVVERLDAGDEQGAVERYAELVERFGATPGAAMLGRKRQLEIGNMLFAHERRELAMTAYDLFLNSYAEDPESPRIRLMVALISARYLNDPVRAKKELDGLEPALRQDGEKRLARELIEELG